MYVCVCVCVFVVVVFVGGVYRSIFDISIKFFISSLISRLHFFFITNFLLMNDNVLSTEFWN